MFRKFFFYLIRSLKKKVFIVFITQFFELSIIVLLGKITNNRIIQTMSLCLLRHKYVIMFMCICVPMSPCPHFPMSLCPNVHMIQCPYVPMSLSTYVPLFLCLYVPLSLCPYVLLSLCCYAPMSLCTNGLVLLSLMCLN